MMKKTILLLCSLAVVLGLCRSSPQSPAAAWSEP